MKLTLTPGQIAYANLQFARVNRAMQAQATADEVRLVQIGQKIQRIKRENKNRK